MENYILYEELGKGRSSVVYKGRRKGFLNYVAIICTDKAKRLEITNHVRLSLDLSHPNIVSFYEWYETSNHLWLVVELCTGGSLQSIISHDSCLSEDVVKKLGWDLVEGLKYIHNLGIIFSDLNPAKILLDGSGILKLSNFCLSKAEGETLEDFFGMLSIPEGVKEQEHKDNFDSFQKRLNGSPAYSPPEVLQGSETNMSSDLWALGCILYYMYTGKPPFSADSYTDLTEMILHQEPPPPRQTVFSCSSPSEDFQDLLKGLLNKNPQKRMDWPELLHHPFWSEVLTEERDVEEEDDEERNGFEGVGSDSSRQRRISDTLTPGEADQLPNNRCVIQQSAHRISKEVIPSQITTSTSHSQSDRQTDSLHPVKDSPCGVLRKSQGTNQEVAWEKREEEVAKYQTSLCLSTTWYKPQ